MHKKEDVNMPGDAGSQDAALFLADVEAQIQYKPAAKRAGRELYAHMENKAEEYRQAGMGEEEAMSRAVKDIGDASALGVMLNQTCLPDPQRLYACHAGRIVFFRKFRIPIRLVYHPSVSFRRTGQYSGQYDSGRTDRFCLRL